MKKKTIKRYKKTKHVGVRYDNWTKSFEAYKTIKGKRYSEYFDQVRDAIHWRNTFTPDAPMEGEILPPVLSQNPMMLLNQNAMNQMVNPLMQQMLSMMGMGTQNQGFQKPQRLLGEALREYVEVHIMSLSHSSQQTKTGVLDFASELFQLSMTEINPNIICQHVLKQKMIAVESENSRRFSFDTELKTLKAFFNWYQQKYDYTFVNPVLKSHFEDGRVKVRTHEKEKKLSPAEIKKIFKAFKELDEFWYGFALTHFYMAGRVQEPAGLQDHCVDFKTGIITIKCVSIWDRKTRKFVELKEYPKNGDIRSTHMTGEVAKILKNRIDNLPKGCHFVFNLNGNPLKYREIQYAYEKALKRAGLYEKCTGTHFMRHSMATITRKVMKSVDSVMSVTGHKDVKVAQDYGAVDVDLELNKESIFKVRDFLSEDG
jgi:integrase